MISILSGKGGVGKSVIAFNLADCLQRRSFRTLLIDASQSGGNQHILANVPVSYGLTQYADGTLSLAEAVTTIREGLDLLAAPGNELHRDEDNSSSVQFIQKLLADAARYDVVIIDHGSGLPDRSTHIARNSDLNLLVLVPELTSISDAYGLFKHLSKNRRTTDCRLLVNRAQSDDEAEYIQSKFVAMAQRFLGVTPLYTGFIPEDIAVRGAIASQTALSEKFPDAPSSLALRHLADAITGHGELVTNSPSESFSRTIHNPAAAADRKG